MVYSEFRLRSVGQGAFYTGTINVNNASFKMVYDCGSLSNSEQLKSEIHNFKVYPRRSNPDTLDVLFLSHLDDDHVNGLKELLTNVTCDQIYLPYLTPIERLFLALQHGPKDTADYDDYLRFLSSPHNYMNELEGAKINAINYITGNSQFMTETGPQEQKPTNNDTNEIIVTDRLNPSDNEDGALEGANLSTNVRFKLANNTILINTIWEFYLYHEPTTAPVLSELHQNIETTFGFKVKGSLKQTDLATILEQKEGLKELRKLYKKQFKSLNKTGLVVMHKPLNYKKAYFREDLFPNYLPNRLTLSHPNLSQVHSVSYDSRIYQWGVSLLTGDICMNQIKDSIYISSHLEDVLVFQVPHHGSAHGWDADYLHDFSQNDQTICMINFGYGNKYGHPNPKVLTDLIRQDMTVRFSNQFDECQYSIHLELR